MLELATLIPRHARFRPDATAVVFGDERLTYAQFGARVARAANLLRSLGIRKGDKVATVLGNSREALELVWAVPAIGAALVPLSPLLMPSGLASLLRDSDAKCLVSQRSMLPALDAIRAELAPLLPGRVLLIDGETREFGDYAALTAAQDETFVPESCGPDDLFNIMYTSGTTGLPKGIMHSHYVRSMYCLLMAAAYRMTPESRTLHAGAIVFNGAYVTMMPSFWLGGTYVLLPQFDAEATIAAIERERITHIVLVPTQIIAILSSPQYRPERLASLECILSLGAPLLQQHKDRLNADLPHRFYELYGLTEGFLTILDREDAVRKAGSVGRPPQHFDMRIVDLDGRDLPPREIGEIVGRGPVRMQGYYKRPDLTQQAVKGGWLFSGDMGYVDEEGFLYLVDRKKDMIDSGGMKVYPRDVEEVVARHPAVREVAVFGVPHEKWGETPVAAVVLREPRSASAAELRDWINERVAARYQRVSEVLVLPDFPRSAAGKTLKRELRAPYWAGREQKI
ncbi:AMP-binding protein [Ramlibacter sp. RBP-2]|uniref:AMP-binding protein n=1 Tax=Ramlibacter lithotrophicus TaxID=2606681 RepID=A0A7X6DDN6_9BURK|nr:AMP-binding protein [Ramlibacter lithotrophicus]NKE65262.1 AMP-binding protein [Ramlibacter lithotrophicus]